MSYVFPLPSDASVHAFTAHIDDRIVKGVVKEKTQARAEYDRAVAQNRQAALLQQENIEGRPPTLTATKILLHYLSQSSS